MELVKFTAMKTYTSIFWNVTVVVMNLVTTVFKQFSLWVARNHKSTQIAPNHSLIITNKLYILTVAGSISLLGTCESIYIKIQDFFVNVT
jgi:hypothetical protein